MLRAVLLALILGLAAAASLAASEVEAGRGLYLEGKRADGTPLTARRAGGLALAGAQAACVNCHRRSALGGAEGRSYIPPLTPDALLQPRPPGRGASAMGLGRPAYTQSSVLHAVNAGIDPAGRRLDYLMPRYALGEEEVRALMAYLGTLAAADEGSGPLHFATVIAPGVAPADRRAMVDVLQACFAEHNAGPRPERGRRKLAGDMQPSQARPWQLHVWELQGAEADWPRQLARHAAAQAPFALVGGVGAGSWSPVHAFCEQGGMPCLFPHVDLPVDSPGSFYPVYLGKGVLLEAGLIAQQLADTPRVVQVLREGDAAARAAADALRSALGAQVEHVLVPLHGTAAALPAGLRAQDALVLWLRPADLQRVGALAAPAARVFLSATLAARDALPMPPAWQERALMAYPFELPSLRARRMQRLQAWLRERGVAPGDERIQSDAHTACMALRTALRDTEGHLHRDYLLEKLEANIERWPATGLYPRLALGVGQRFASKTGYLVRVDAAGQLSAAGERSAP